MEIKNLREKKKAELENFFEKQEYDFLSENKSFLNKKNLLFNNYTFFSFFYLWSVYFKKNKILKNNKSFFKSIVLTKSKEFNFFSSKFKFTKILKKKKVEPPKYKKKWVNKRKNMLYNFLLTNIQFKSLYKHDSLKFRKKFIKPKTFLNQKHLIQFFNFLKKKFKKFLNQKKTELFVNGVYTNSKSVMSWFYNKKI